MGDARPWYREPETFIAVTALVVSVSPSRSACTRLPRSAAIFDEYWQLSDSAVGHRTRWERVDHCPAQRDGDF